MKVRIISLLLAATFSLFLSHSTTAQSTASNSNSTSPTLNPKLAEAEKLNLEVFRLYKEGHPADAIQFAKRVLKLREELLGDNHPSVANAANNVGLLYVSSGKPMEAESYYRRSLSIYEKNSAGNELMLAKTLDSLADILAQKFDLKAESYFQRAIDVKEKALGTTHVETVASMNNLADFYFKKHKYEKAELVLRRLAAVREKENSNSIEFAKTLERLACSISKNKKPDAEATEARAHHILYAAAAEKHQPIQMDEKILACRMITEVDPMFPAMIHPEVGSWKIVVAVEVDETGNVTSAQMIAGDPRFKKNVEKAALSSKVKPTLVDGQAVKVKSSIVREFAITTEIREVITTSPATMERP